MAIEKLKIKEVMPLISKFFRDTIITKINEIIDAVKSIQDSGYNTVYYGVACSDESTPLTVAQVLSFRMPHAMTLTEVRGSLVTAQSAGDKVTVTATANGTPIFSTDLTFDNGEETTTTASVPAVISLSDIDDDAEIVINVSQIGAAGDAAGLKIWFIGEKIV